MIRIGIGGAYDTITLIRTPKIVLVLIKAPTFIMVRDQEPFDQVTVLPYRV